MVGSRLRHLCAAALIVVVAGCSDVQEVEGPRVKPKPGSPQAILDASAQATVSTTSDLAEKADVPLYPGAETPQGASNLKTNGTQLRYELVMSTSDLPPAVLDFYKKKLKNAEQTGPMTMMGMSPKGHFVKVSTQRVTNRTDIDVVATDESAAKSGDSK